MTRHNLTRLAVVSAFITLAFPLASYASAPGPVSPKAVTPADTLTKIEKVKSERVAPTPRKKLKSRQTAPTQSHSDFGPDQPWETEFYVENDIGGRRELQLALASFSRRR